MYVIPTLLLHYSYTYIPTLLLHLYSYTDFDLSYLNIIAVIAFVFFFFRALGKFFRKRRAARKVIISKIISFLYYVIDFILYMYYTKENTARLH